MLKSYTVDKEMLRTDVWTGGRRITLIASDHFLAEA